MSLWTERGEIVMRNGQLRHHARIVGVNGAAGTPDCQRRDGARLSPRLPAPWREVAVTTPADPAALLRSREYVRLLVVAAILGVPVSAAAYGFLALVDYLQKEIFTHLPHGLGFSTEPLWWPLPVLAVGGALAALAISYLPGGGGPSPVGRFKLHGRPAPGQLPGVILAALTTLIFGAVLGPEMPLILIGGGLVLVVLRAARRQVPDQARSVLASSGSFASISTLLGSPILGAFLLMEASGLGGPMLGLVLLPGLLAAGIGSLIFVGLDNWTGLGTFSLAIPGLPHFGHPTLGEFGWALVIGVAAALAGAAIRWLGRLVHPYAERWTLLAVPLAGLAVAGLAVGYAEGTGKASSDVLFSGQSALPHLIQHSASYSVGALLLLMACKGLAYGVSLGSFRGGPIFPAMFLGAAGGIALSHLPGLPVVAGVAMGIGAMSVVMLTLPLTSVLLATLLLLSDGLAVMPLVIVAVVVAHVTAARIAPASLPEGEHAGRHSRTANHGAAVRARKAAPRGSVQGGGGPGPGRGGHGLAGALPGWPRRSAVPGPGDVGPAGRMDTGGISHQGGKPGDGSRGRHCWAGEGGRNGASTVTPRATRCASACSPSATTTRSKTTTARGCSSSMARRCGSARRSCSRTWTAASCARSRNGCCTSGTAWRSRGQTVTGWPWYTKP